MKTSLLALVLIVVLSSGVAHAYGEKGVVINVNDNLTMDVVLSDGSLECISLYGVYVPSNLFQEAKAFLENKLKGKTVYYFTKGTDSYSNACYAHLLQEGESVQYSLVGAELACGNSSSACPLGRQLSRIGPDFLLFSSR